MLAWLCVQEALKTGGYYMKANKRASVCMTPGDLWYGTGMLNGTGMEREVVEENL